MRLSLLATVVGIGFFSLACAGGKDKDGDTDAGTEDPVAVDRDGDGYDEGEDCNDGNADVHPGATEVCDAGDVDEDCNGTSDNGDTGLSGGIEAFHDADGDGFGAESTYVCEVSSAYVADGGDCDDDDAAINPAAVEVCDAADVDEDCSGAADDADPDVLDADRITAWQDADGDGYGDAGAESRYCDVPAGWVLDDADCADGVAAAYPGATELCNTIDDDCDGTADEDDAADAPTWYDDDDGDGHGDASAPYDACAMPDGFAADDTDCDDTSAGVYPAATETCDGEDDDCDGAVDEDDAADASTWFRDADGDSYGTAGTSLVQCDSPAGYVANDDDCDDGSAAVSPADSEICDAAGVDEDCDGLVDDADTSALASTKTTFYADGDGDTYGNAATTGAWCDIPAGYVTNDDDCDDTRATVSPADPEICDGSNRDEDCDSLADDADGSVSSSGYTTWYLDADYDGYGVPGTTTASCDVPSGYASVSTDCDDTDGLRNPGRAEVCDASDRDEDCDSLADDADSSVTASTRTTWYLDTDGDEYGVSTSSVSLCDVPAGYTAADDDCDDTEADTNPGAVDACFDTVDADCDGVTSCARDTGDAERKLLGATAGDGLSNAQSAGDIDGDGVDDLILGAGASDHYASNAGAAFLVLGGGSGDLDLSSADAIFVGSGGNIGSAVAGAGDLDGDGQDDLVIASSESRGPDSSYAGAGRVYFLGGPQSGTVNIYSTASYYYGESSYDALGATISAPGDLDGDGADDLMLGAYYGASDVGAVYIVGEPPSGAVDIATAATGVVTGVSSNDYVGLITGAGDIDGDGNLDMLVGAEYGDVAGFNYGAAYVVLGPVSGTVSVADADTTVTGAGYLMFNDGEMAAGDLDGDGYDDLLVGMPGYNWGAIFVYQGPVTGTLALTSADARIEGAVHDFARTFEADCDMNGDGRADLLYGHRRDDTVGSAAGAAYVMPGPISGTHASTAADVQMLADSASQQFGYRVAYAGAQDGSTTGCSILVGAYSDDEGGSDAGAVFVFSPSVF